MKKLIVLICCFSLSSCFFNWEDNTTTVDPVFSRYDPVVLTVAALENSIEIQDKKEVTEASKIYIIHDFIFINDKRTGFHIFDNSDPSNPIKKKFLKAPGATDIAIRNNVLYINQATDLVVLTFDFTAFTTIVSKRVKNVFPELRSPDGESFYEEDKVVVNWIQK
ncbi:MULTISPECIES: hypothetical protein [unclassified Polaribacter]|uniref:hypothetical protein n=1 Tax=unclassified Polaribacter TaxID=196858 RepID=UPI0011BE93D7|nr:MULTISPECIES: hypothetical protein [unclassified Polaribacter]TXD52411.1 hypothetical protein ES043_08430 [Polaribacter sp. IC063]TXD61048.1 hypothetical protein ES044_05700 [Polaribacter sp. IC066]